MAILICATMMLSNGYTQSYNDDSKENLLSNFVNLTEDYFGQIEDSVSRDSNSDVRVVYPDSFENEGTRDEKPFDEETETRNNNYVPNSVTVNTSYAVGEIPITSSVTQMGAVTYTVPIEVYPGINGMHPELALVYNSMAGNGYMGVGWNVAGLSSITRGNKSIYYDGKAEGVKMDTDDAFYLDGMRLIKLSETSNQIKYETEQGKILVTAHLYTLGQILKRISYFEVFFPNGKRAIYGFSGNRSDRLEYPLTEVTDLYNNKMEFEYTYGNGHYRIDKIKYSFYNSNAGATVEFQYKSSTRPDVISFYSAGLNVKKDKLLEKVVCKFGSSVLRTYQFDYETHNISSVLKQIDLKAANGTCFNPLLFSYGTGNNSTECTAFGVTMNSSAYTFERPKITKGKFDYGTDDDGLIVYIPYNPYVKKPLLSFPLPSKDEYWFENDYPSTGNIYLYTLLRDGVA